MNQRQDPKKVLDQQYDRRLDRLYTSLVRCPYCKNRIRKLQTTCSRCGLNKIQIAHASNKRAKEMIKAGERGKIVMMRRRPSDVKLSSMTWRLAVGGLFGLHNFYVGRRIRGWIVLGCMIAFIIQGLVFSPGDFTNNLEGIHPWRAATNTQGMPFPLDFFGLVAFALWISDIVGVVLGWYKYPVRLGEAKSGDTGQVTGDR